jgi:hypothetical protein
VSWLGIRRESARTRQWTLCRPVETDCHFESICESCTFFVTTNAFRPTLQAQRDDAQNK